MTAEKDSTMQTETAETIAAEADSTMQTETEPRSRYGQKSACGGISKANNVRQIH